MRKRKSIHKELIKNYMLTLFIMWAISIAIGSNILGYFSMFFPYIITTFVLYMFHVLFYNYLSLKYNRIIKNVLIIFFPIGLVIFTYALSTIAINPQMKKFKIVRTTKGTCGDKTKKPVKYFNNFFSGKKTSKFMLERNSHQISWYPNEENYYKYDKGDSIKIKVKKNFLNMEIIAQEDIN